MSAMASQITIVSIVYSIVCSVQINENIRISVTDHYSGDIPGYENNFSLWNVTISGDIPLNAALCCILSNWLQSSVLWLMFFHRKTTFFLNQWWPSYLESKLRKFWKANDTAKFRKKDGFLNCWGLVKLISSKRLTTWHRRILVNIDASLNTGGETNSRHFADDSDTFKSIFLNENVRISIKISLKFVPRGPINNIPAFEIMAWCRPGDKPLSEPMMVCLLTHICVAWPRWVKLDHYW